MKKFTLYYLLLLAVVFNLASCGDKDEDTPAPSKQTLLTTKTWKVSKAIVDGEDMVQDPFLGYFYQYTYKFNTDKTYTFSLLTISEPGMWEFASNETVIVLNPGTDDEERWTITELKENSLKATYVDPTDNSKTEYEFVPKL